MRYYEGRTHVVRDGLQQLLEQSCSGTPVSMEVGPAAGRW